MWTPYERLIGNFGPDDGSIDFYTRITSLATSERVLLDLGAGRGAWYEDDKSSVRRNTRLMKGKFGTVIAADVDSAVELNRSADSTLLVKDGVIPLHDNHVDVVVCDYVIEHVDNVAHFTSEIARVLKPGGWFCARTPHKYNYVAVASRLIGVKLEAPLISHAQPSRKHIDIFKKHYLMNTHRAIRLAFKHWSDYSFIYRTEPAYYFGSRLVFSIQSIVHRIAPAPLIGNLFIFVQKPEDPRDTARSSIR